MAIPKKMLKWRKGLLEGSIMRSKTFKGIVSKTMKRYGISRERAEKVAGKAYWTTLRKKYRTRKK